MFRSWLIPYIYTKTRVAYDTGVSLIRPLYYQWPNIDNAYEFKQQYMFGDEIMVRPIVEPGDNSTLVRNVAIWLPPGCWYEKGMTLIEVKDKNGKMILASALASYLWVNVSVTSHYLWIIPSFTHGSARFFLF